VMLRPVARTTDPATSQYAATVAARVPVTAEIEATLAVCGPLTGHELAERLSHRDDGTVKSAVSRLANAGRLERCGVRALPGRRCPQTVVRLAPIQGTLL